MYKTEWESMEVIKKLLLFMAMSIGFTSFAMQSLESDIKKLRVGEEPLPVTLQSQEGCEFQIRLRQAKLSETLNHLIEDAGTDNPIPLPNIDTATLATLVPLMNELDQLLAKNEAAKPEEQIYIPSKFQPSVDNALYGKSYEQVESVLLAANYLDIPLIINAAASVIARRIHQSPQWQKFELGKDMPIPEELDFIFKTLNKILAEMPEEVKTYVAKHVLLRRQGIFREYSVSDYIRGHGQPQLVKWITHGDNTIYLAAKNLTSLFGIDQLIHKRHAVYLNLANNYFFDISLDPQLIKCPFAGFVELRELHMGTNRITRVPRDLLAGLSKLTKLDLGYNQLTVLPKKFLIDLKNLETLYLHRNKLVRLDASLSGLRNLVAIHLFDNQLTHLPAGLLSDLFNLRVLKLDDNEFTPEEQDRIRDELPNKETKVSFELLFKK